MNPRLLPLCVLLLSMPASVSVAQDVTILPPAWLDERNVAGEQPPEFKGRPRVAYPRELKESDEVGYMLLVQTVDEKGKRTVLAQTASHPYFRRAVFEATDTFESSRPAMREGQPVDSVSWFAVIFNPASAAVKSATARPRLEAVAPVLVPVKELAPLRSDQLPVVWVTVALDAAAQLTGITFTDEAERFRGAIEASMPQWRFAPARQAGQPVAAELRVPIIVQPRPRPDLANQATPPRAVKRVPPVYPVALRRNRIRGEVVMTCEIDAEGRVQNAVVERSSHPAFNEPALDAIRQWRFEPALRKGEPVAVKMSVPLIFSIDGGTDVVTLKGGSDLSKLPEALRYDTPPKPRNAVLPVYPYEQLKTGASGRAVVAVLVGPNGKVMDVRLTEASAPEFGLALAAMAELLVFEPALKEGQATPAMLRVERDFKRNAELVSSRDRTLLRLEEKNPQKIVGPAALDAPLRPISRRAPVFPVVLRDEHATGEALVECLIDEDGRARLPRVVNATAPEFGYAAVQAVAAWEFEPPKAGGKAATVRARIPFRFKLHDDVVE